VDVRWINPFVTATQRACMLMGGIKILAQPAKSQSVADSATVAEMNQPLSNTE